MDSRKYAAILQSPGTAKAAKEAYQSQLNANTSERKPTKKRVASSDDVVVNELLRRRGNEEAHHKAILNTLAPLYDGLNETQAAELTAYLSQYGAIGNNLRNLVNMPKDTHQAGIHAFAREQGFEHHPNLNNPIGFVRDIQDAASLPPASSLPYRKHVGEQYMTQAVPEMNAYINDMLTAHPSMQEVLDLSSVREAMQQEAIQQAALEATGLRLAGDKLAKFYDQSRQDSPGTSKMVVVDAAPGAYVRVNGNGKR